jgi:hypothetical protein
LNHPQALVLSDGALYVPYHAWWNPVPAGTPRDMAWYTTSRDGGLTFDAPKRMTTRSGVFLYEAYGTVRAAFAVDARSANYRDRIYMVVRKNGDARPGSDKRLYFSMSTDRGTAWSEPNIIDPTAPLGSTHQHARIAVDANGVIGVSWFDSLIHAGSNSVTK